MDYLTLEISRRRSALIDLLSINLFTERNMTRTEHMQWAKKRALEYVEAGNLTEAFSSIASDLQKHPDTADHIGVQLGMMQMMTGMLGTPDKMRDFITGFN